MLRFSYNNNDNPDESGYDTSDADIKVVVGHIKQLGRVIRKWSHVIMAVEAGFIGAWGEWYYSKNYNDPNNGFVPTRQHQKKRRRLVRAMLRHFGGDLQILIRYVSAARNVIRDAEPLTETEAFDGSKKSRIGLHNDCFLASETDYGTHENSDEKNWLEQQSKFTFVGGETCRVNKPR